MLLDWFACRIGSMHVIVPLVTLHDPVAARALRFVAESPS
jgi:hypothetical protein